MSLLLVTHYQLAKTSLRQNRTRSFLTCLGISIGIASIILILSFTGSIKNLVADQIKNVGADLIVIRPTTHKDPVTNIVENLASSNQYLKSNLTLKDVEAIKELPNIAAVAPIAVATNTITSGDNSVQSATVLGTNPDFATIQTLPLQAGSFFASNFQKNTAVIGHNLSLTLFNTPESAGKTFNLFGERFAIVGVLAKTEDPVNFNNVDLDNAMIVNADFLSEISSNLQIQQINVKVTTTNAVADTVETITSTLQAEKSGDSNFSVLAGENITHPANSLFSIMTNILTLVAGVSLIVGGIGVMNIMLVSVSERTHEIGIRKAVGASSSQILLQFLFEALILSLLGGFFGLILAYIIAFFISTISPFAPFISLEILLVTIGTSLLVGVFFGLYPALKAAHKNPIDSLKYYR